MRVLPRREPAHTHTHSEHRRVRRVKEDTEGKVEEKERGGRGSRCVRRATRGKRGGICRVVEATLRRESTGSGRVSLLAVCFVALARKEVC